LLYTEENQYWRCGSFHLPNGFAFSFCKYYQYNIWRGLVVEVSISISEVLFELCVKRSSAVVFYKKQSATVYSCGIFFPSSM